MSFYQIDTSFLPLKVIYFFFYASASCLMSYKSLFQKSLGMTPAQNGVLQSLERFLIMMFPPLIGALADMKSKHKFLLNACLILFSTVTFPGYFTPGIQSESSVTLCKTNRSLVETVFLCNSTSKNKFQCSNNEFLYTECSSSSYTDSNSTFTSSASKSCNQTVECTISSNETSFFGTTFVLLALFTTVYAVVSAPIGPMLDATTFQILASEKRQNYGRQRLFGSIGFGAGALATGYVTDYYTKLIGSETTDYLFVFVLTTALGIVASGISLKLNVPAHHMQSIVPGLKLIFTNKNIALFVWIVLVQGTVQSIKYTYLFWYAGELRGSSNTVFGLAVVSDCLSEVPMFFLSSWFLKKMGHKLCLTVGLLFASLRTLLYAYLTDAWQMVLLEAINGVAFALPMAAMCSYVYKLSPDGMTTTFMSLVQGLYWGLSNVIGSFFGGFLYEKFGALSTFKYTAALGLFGAVSFYSLSMCCAKNSSTSENKKDELELNESKQEMLKQEDRLEVVDESK